MNEWRKFRLLEGWERQSFVQSLVLLPLNGIALRLLSLKRWQSILARLSRMNPRQVVNSPVEVTVNGRPATIINQYGFDGGWSLAVCSGGRRERLGLTLG